MLTRFNLTSNYYSTLSHSLPETLQKLGNNTKNFCVKGGFNVDCIWKLVCMIMFCRTARYNVWFSIAI